MRCGKARAYLSRQLDELLPPEATASLVRHLDACAACRQYRQDLSLGRRLLAATPPPLAENFEWRLHLRLNQALQQAAGSTAYPWEPQDGGRRLWLRNFAGSASWGLAAALAVALLWGGGAGDGRPAATPALGPQAAQVAAVAADRQDAGPDPTAPDRLPLQAERISPLVGGSGVQHQVAAGYASGSRMLLDRGWSGDLLRDLDTIQNLRLQNRRLTNQIYQYQLQIAKMRARLDSSDSNALDLKAR